MVNTTNDGLQDLVTAFAEATLNDPGEKPIPMATTDADEVLRSQLTENTGTHFLDSGGACGRHWEENQETPPWEQPEWVVSDDYVTHNVYHYLDRVLDRDRSCVALEAALYGYGYSGPGEGESWLTCMEGFAETVLDGTVGRAELSDIGVPDEFVEDVLGISGRLRSDRGGSGPMTVNTYNGYDTHGLSQVLKGTNLGGPYSEYVFLQVHQGADVRGGYTGPRVYTTDGWIPHELSFNCHRCDWSEAESVLYGEEDLLYQRSIDPFELEDKGWIEEGDEEHPALERAYGDDAVDGAVFHRCEGPIGNVGYVSFW